MFWIQHGNQSIILQYLLQVKVLRQVKILRQIASYTLHNDFYGQVTNLNAPAYTVVFYQCVYKPSLFNILTCATLAKNMQLYIIIQCIIIPYHFYCCCFTNPSHIIVFQVISIFHFSILLAWVLANSSTWLWFLIRVDCLHHTTVSIWVPCDALWILQLYSRGLDPELGPDFLAQCAHRRCAGV